MKGADFDNDGHLDLVFAAYGGFGIDFSLDMEMEVFNHLWLIRRPIIFDRFFWHWVISMMIRTWIYRLWLSIHEL